MSTEKAQIIQRLAFSEFISKYYPSEYINEGLEDKTELTQEIMESMILLNSRSKHSVAKCGTSWMLSGSSSGISFAKSNRGIQNARLFSAEQFRCTLRSKLGTGPLEDPPDKEVHVSMHSQILSP